MSIGVRRIFQLPTTTTITSNAVLADIPGFTMDVAAGQIVTGRAVVLFSLGATGGVRFQLTTTGTGVCRNAVFLVNVVTPATIPGFINNLNTPFTNALAVAGSHYCIFDFSYTVTTAGILSLQAAQNTSDVLGLNLFSGSSMDVIVL